MNKGEQIEIRRCANGFVVTPSSCAAPISEWLVFRSLDGGDDSLVGFLKEHFEDGESIAPSRTVFEGMTFEEARKQLAGYPHLRMRRDSWPSEIGITMKDGKFVLYRGFHSEGEYFAGELDRAATNWVVF